jgi:crotonobetainyl-CoA:carnitine CoA-transferase CaiB-like acyl-CoA transferase
VADLTGGRAGPVAGMLLADLDADVVKGPAPLSPSVTSAPQETQPLCPEVTAAAPARSTHMIAQAYGCRDNHEPARS